MGADVKAGEQDGRNISPSLFFDYDPDCFDMSLWWEESIKADVFSPKVWFWADLSVCLLCA